VIPFVDLKAQYQGIKEEVNAAIQHVLDTCQFTLGPEVASFEQEFAAYSGGKIGVAVNTGTSALHLSLLAAGVGRGDEVITVPFTFVATVSAIDYTGAKAVLVDIDPVTFTMDVKQLEAAITPKTKAIIPVDLYGQVAEYKGRRAGSMADMTCFSFYPGKNLGAYGEAGMVVTDNAEYARTLRMLRDWGAEKKYHHVLKGYNFRMEGIQGAVLRVKLRKLEAWTEARRTAAGHYDRMFAGTKVQSPKAMGHNRHVYHIYAVRTPNRQAWQDALLAQGIQSGIHYPTPVHLLPAFADLGYKAGQFPHSERAANEVLSLPMFPEITQAQCEEVARAVIGLAEGHVPAAPALAKAL
jgi:dTDP-4-amino-4,6-dideoxygalactose transaminase